MKVKGSILRSLAVLVTFFILTSAAQVQPGTPAPRPGNRIRAEILKPELPLDESTTSFCDSRLRNADWSTLIPYAPGAVVLPFKVGEPTLGGNPAEHASI